MREKEREREREREREKAVLRLTFIHVTDETLAVNRAHYGSCARPRYPGVEDEFRRATCLRETHPYPSYLLSCDQRASGSFSKVFFFTKRLSSCNGQTDNQRLERVTMVFYPIGEAGSMHNGPRQ